MKETIDEIKLIGLALKNKTSNINGQSHLDCKNLWHTFEDAKLAETIPDKISKEVLGVYFGYEGDSTQAFRYFIGCKVNSYAANCTHLQTLTIPGGNYQKIVVKGKLPDCMMEAWKDIWSGNLHRTYQVDFEVYDARCKDWENAEVDIYVSVK